MFHLLRVFAVTLGLVFVSLSLTHCGPEKSSDELLKDQQDRQDKLSKNELLDLAQSRRALVEAWDGCYKATYSNGGPTTVYVRLKKWVRLVTPKDQVEPLEMPEVWAFLRAPTDTRGEYVVALTSFEANTDASFIVVSQAATLTTKNGVRLELNYNPEGQHTGVFQGGAMPSPQVITLEPTALNKCEIN